MIKKLSLLFLICFSIQAFGTGVKNEYYNYTHFTSESGLPHSLVFDIIQGPAGFIWVATNNGLGRFDGYEFKVYRPKINKTGGISGKSVYRLFADSHNNLWMGIQGIGLNKMDMSTEYVTKYMPRNEMNGISGNDIQFFYEDADSVLWVGTNKGLDYYRRETNQFIPCFEPATDNYNSIIRIAGDKASKIWYLHSSGKLGIYNKQLKTIEKVPELLSRYIVNDFLIQEGSILWLGTRFNGLICYNIESGRLIQKYPEFTNSAEMFLHSQGSLFVHIRKDSDFLGVINTQNYKEYIFPRFFTGQSDLFLNFAEDKKGNLWISSGEGLFKVNTSQEILRVNGKSRESEDLLVSNIYSHFIDEHSNLWLSSERKGVLMIDLNQKDFSVYDYMEPQNPVVGGSNISMVYEDSKGNLWVGCHSQGVSKFNPKTLKSEIIPYSPIDPTKLNYRAPAGFAEDNQGNIWIGFYDGPLVSIDPQTMRPTYYNETVSDPERYFKANTVRSMLIGQNNNLWLITNTSGLVERNMSTGEFIYHSEKYEKDYLSNSHYRYLYQSADGLFWIGTQNGGLTSYNQHTKEFKKYINNPDDKTSISGNTVYFVHEESDSILWIGTDKGLNRFNKNLKQFEAWRQTIYGDMCSVYRIYPDNEGNLWLSGDCGVVKFNKAKKTSIKYLKSDGLPTNEFNTTAGCKTSWGEIFLGSTNGLISFFPENIKPNPYHAAPELTQLKIFNQTVTPGDTIMGEVVLEKSISLTNKLVLPNYINDFTLEFSAMHFSAPHKNEYQYKLEGFNNSWIQTQSTRRWANYTGLPPGNYTFHLKATNNDGVYCPESKEVNLEIEILPPFSETTWFRMLLLVIVLLVIWIIIQLRLKSVKRQKELLESKVVSRTQQLNEKNVILEERQEEISIQNEELEKHRNHLEDEVAKRTIELEKAKLKAEESDRLKSAFLANMSHEIRTPMNAILGFSSLLQHNDLKDEEKQQYTELILNNGETLLNLLNDIIDISMIESGQLRIKNKEVDLNSLLSNLFAVFKRDTKVYSNPNLKLEFIPGSTNQVIIRTDPVRLTQVLNNLLGNAIKYTSKGKIILAYKLNNQEIEFKVSDSGIGIPEEAAKAIFERFNKIEYAGVDFYRGGGLGLSISKSLVEMLGGKIWVESQPNKGSVFYFTLPLA